MSLPQWSVRAILVAASLGLWFWTQALIARRAFPEGRIGDRLLELTAPLHRFLLENDRWANRLLIGSSALIDALGIFLVASAIFGPSARPFVGLLILFGLRQLCQALCALPCPDGMIWRSPGFPSLLVTYGTASDLFFSGHTAIAVYGCLELGHWGGPAFAAVGAVIALVEASTVLVLRAHYTMDVFAGAMTALWVWTVASAVAPRVDAWLALLGR
jgi:hypothetical protein